MYPQGLWSQRSEGLGISELECGWKTIHTLFRTVWIISILYKFVWERLLSLRFLELNLKGRKAPQSWQARYHCQLRPLFLNSRIASMYEFLCVRVVGRVLKHRECKRTAPRRGWKTISPKVKKTSLINFRCRESVCYNIENVKEQHQGEVERQSVQR